MAENVRSGERIFDLLEELAQQRGPVGLTELAAKTSLSKTTAHRLMQTLCSRQYALKTPDSRYLIGPKVIELASYHIEHLELHRVANPLLIELSTAFKMPVYLGKVIYDRVVYISIPDKDMLRDSVLDEGVGIPAYPSAIGKCIFASMSGDEFDEMLYKHPLVKYTDKTVTDPVEYKKMLKRVRADGWALDDAEFLSGDRCIAAPVYDYSGTVIAAIAMSGDPDQLSGERFNMAVESLKKTATVISRGMGYLP